MIKVLGCEQADDNETLRYLYGENRSESRRPVVRAAFQFRLGLWMRLVINLDQFFHRNVGVDLRRRETSVAEQLLDVAKIGAAV